MNNSYTFPLLSFLTELGWFDQAKIQFDKALEMSPNELSILFNKVLTLKRIRKI